MDDWKEAWDDGAFGILLIHAAALVAGLVILVAAVVFEAVTT